MTSKKSAKPPRLVEGIDVRTLPIGPQEAFILSRVDGSASPADIALSTGLDEDQVQAGLERLAEIRAIRYEAASERPQQEAQHQVGFDTPPSKPPPYNLAELDEEVDLTLEKKRRVLDTYHRLEELSHYELLGVARDADKKSIKAKYYEVVNTFHPDRYFGKNLGAFKAKMEAVFARITLAHDTLTRAKPRQEYDEYLEIQLKTRQFDELMDSQSPVELAAEAKPAVDATAKQRVPQAVAAGAPSADALATARFRAVRPKRRASDPEVRRRALARKLRTSGNPGPRSSGTMPAVRAPVDKDFLKQQVAEGLKVRFASQAERSTAAQVEHYLDAAEQAARDKDPLSAANALRIASQLAPDNDELAGRLAEAQAKAAAELADNYLEQARYEEREGRYLKAAQSYERAAVGKKSPSLYHHAASCLVEGGGELKHAADLAKMAVHMAPDHAEYRMTLSRVYAAAKMLTSATAEAEKAVKLAPENESAKKWLKRVKRGEI